MRKIKFKISNFFVTSLFKLCGVLERKFIDGTEKEEKNIDIVANYLNEVSVFEKKTNALMLALKSNKIDKNEYDDISFNILKAINRIKKEYIKDFFKLLISK